MKDVDNKKFDMCPWCGNKPYVTETSLTHVCLKLNIVITIYGNPDELKSRWNWTKVPKYEER